MSARNFFIWLSDQHWLAHPAMRWNHAWHTAERFIPGQTLHDGLHTALMLQKQNILCDLDHLGENVETTSEAKAAADAYVATLDAIHKHRLKGTGLSIKCSQLGIDVSRKLCIAQIKRVLGRAALYNRFVHIDMEGSWYTTRILNIFNNLRKKHRNVGITVQAYLKHTPKDLKTLIRSRSRVRLVKGVYGESADIALQGYEEIRKRYLELLHQLLRSRCHVAIATHDEVIIKQAQQWIKAMRIPKSRYEFQFLYSVKQGLQRRTAKKHPVRVYVPFGREWWPYYVRRLAERPKNVFDLVKL